TQDRNIKIHKGEGFSDHLPIFAKFSINENITKNNPQVEENLSTISSLYKKEKLIEPIFLNDVIVIYKDDEKAIIKKENDRAIYIYQNAKDLKLGYSYNLQINQIYDFFGLKEIKDFFISKENKEIKNYKDLYLDTSNIDIFDFKYENEVITNLTGIVKNGKLYINENKFIKLFAKDKNILPKDDEKITILNAQLGSYKGNMQIILHQLSDYKVEK
ncbi:endonuclease, partial [Aliarcobacter butzleri]